MRDEVGADRRGVAWSSGSETEEGLPPSELLEGAYPRVELRDPMLPGGVKGRGGAGWSDARCSRITETSSFRSEAHAECAIRQG